MELELVAWQFSQSLSMVGLVLSFLVLLVAAVNSQTPLEALESIAQFDELRCVPKLLCEMAAGFRKTNFIGADALLKLLSSELAGAAEAGSGAGAMLVLGRAALLGVAARGNVYVCGSAYPACPRDPDRLVHYLNNHRGGFFRFFGVRTGTGQLRLDDVDHFNSPDANAPFKFPKTFNLPHKNGAETFNLPHKKDAEAFKFPHKNGVDSDAETFKFPHKNGVNSDAETFKFPHKNGVNSDAETFNFPHKNGVESDAETFKFPRGQVGDSKRRISKKLRFPDDGLVRKRRLVMF